MSANCTFCGNVATSTVQRVGSLYFDYYGHPVVMS